MEVSVLNVTNGDAKRRKRYADLYSSIVLPHKRPRTDKRKISFLKIPTLQSSKGLDEPEESVHPTVCTSLETIEEIPNEKDEHTRTQNSLLEIIRLTKAVQGGDSLVAVEPKLQEKEDPSGWLVNYYRYSSLTTAEKASSRAASSVPSHSHGSSRPIYDLKAMLQPTTLDKFNLLDKKVNKGIPCCMTMTEPDVTNEKTGPEEIKWSIRKSMCAACSQKWRDLTAIANIKNSGLRRRAMLERMPSCLAPARLKNSIKTQYCWRSKQYLDNHKSDILSNH